MTWGYLYPYPQPILSAIRADDAHPCHALLLDEGRTDCGNLAIVNTVGRDLLLEQYTNATTILCAAVAARDQRTAVFWTKF